MRNNVCKLLNIVLTFTYIALAAFHSFDKRITNDFTLVYSIFAGLGIIFVAIFVIMIAFLFGKNTQNKKEYIDLFENFSETIVSVILFYLSYFVNLVDNHVYFVISMVMIICVSAIIYVAENYILKSLKSNKLREEDN